MNDETIPATKLRRDLGAVLDAVLMGRTIRVERSGRPLAVLLPPEEYERLLRVEDWAMARDPLGEEERNQVAKP